MEDGNICDTLKYGEQVSSTYAEIYFEDKDATLDNVEVYTKLPKNQKRFSKFVKSKDEWKSPSDLLIGTIKLIPPFTSKITRGKTHEGILAIGNLVLENERKNFLALLTNLLNNNDTSWNYILRHEKQEVIKKVKLIFQNIFKFKSEIMKKELMQFFEQSLADLDKYMKTEMQVILQTAYSSTISDLNNQIFLKLQKERKKLENILQRKYAIEIQKVKKYYTLLLNNERYRNDKLVKNSIQERNEALRIFYKQIEAQRTTTTMYVMTMERKKCKVQKMLLQNLQTAEITEKLNNIKERTENIEAFRKNHIGILDINIKWENNIKNILKIFLKFIAFSLKLLPEQTTFLLDLEKMVVIQLQEIRKKHETTSSILINKESEANAFKFEKSDQKIQSCEMEPFVLFGDLSYPVPPQYGSRETLPSEVELTHFRLQRQCVYAKCHGFESIKQFLQSQHCQCRTTQQSTQKLNSKDEKPVSYASTSVTRESSFESLLVDDVLQVQECPLRKCGKWIERNSFPLLTSYVDYTEENFRRVTAILGKNQKNESLPDFIDPKTIAYIELPFSATKESHRTVGTQYSSQEDLTSTQLSCPCIEKVFEQCQTSISSKTTRIQNIEAKRRRSLEILTREHPSLFKLFTDECFDYKL
ncbi:unnamed protein product, partial [Brenthis ino]